MTKDELYSALVCALTHDMHVCESCKQCPGKTFIEIRMNLVRELAKKEKKYLPWKEEKDD